MPAPGTRSAEARRDARISSERTRPGGLRRWTPTVGGSALAVLGVSRRSPAGVVLAAAGASLAYAAWSDRTLLPGWLRSRLPTHATGGLSVERAVTILRPVEEVYATWRDFERLPRVMRHLESVTPMGNGRWRWLASGPAGQHVQWDVEIVEERPNELIRWRSLPGSQVITSGEARFNPAPGHRGTELRARLDYQPPAGTLGASVAWLFGAGADRQVRESLRAFKQILEAGEIATNDDQPVGTCVGGRSHP